MLSPHALTRPITSTMYETFYGLRERPFDLLPNPRYLFLAGRHREAFSSLQYGIGAPRGLMLLIGEAGTGKTTLITSVLTQIDTSNTECVLLSNPTLTRTEFYEFLIDGFKLPLGPMASKTQFLFEFRNHLLERHANGHLSALVLDEAQSLPSELLEEVRLLSNIETSTVKLLNVVLAGQPELATRLNETGLRQLKQRISLRCELAPFDYAESAAYIAGRLRIAGGEPRQIFSREAVLAIHEMSSGIPRTINVICDNALIGGFAAQARPVSRGIVDEVCRDFDVAAGPLVSSVSDRSIAGPTTAAAVTEEGESEKPSLFASATRKKRFSFF